MEATGGVPDLKLRTRPGFGPGPQGGEPTECAVGGSPILSAGQAAQWTVGIIFGLPHTFGGSGA